MAHMENDSSCDYHTDVGYSFLNIVSPDLMESWRSIYLSRHVLTAIYGTLKVI